MNGAIRLFLRCGKYKAFLIIRICDSPEYRQSQHMALSTIGTLEDTPSFGSKGAILHVLAVDSKIKDSLPITTIFACESSSVRE